MSRSSIGGDPSGMGTEISKRHALKSRHTVPEGIVVHGMCQQASFPGRALIRSSKLVATLRYISFFLVCSKAKSA